MLVNRKFFPSKMQDNDENFIALLLGMIESIDELCSIEIIKKTNCYSFRIATSVPKYIPMLLDELKKFHNMYRIVIYFSKSIKTSGVINFTIKTQ
jgi:hypothetical protein